MTGGSFRTCRTDRNLPTVSPSKFTRNKHPVALTIDISACIRLISDILTWIIVRIHPFGNYGITFSFAQRCIGPENPLACSARLNPTFRRFRRLYRCRSGFVSLHQALEQSIEFTQLTSITLQLSREVFYSPPFVSVKQPLFATHNKSARGATAKDDRLNMSLACELDTMI